MFNINQGKRKYGEWGITALEAAALGKIVVTNFLSIDRYKIEYGDCPLVVCNTIDQLKDNISELSKMSKEEILEKKEENVSIRIKNTRLFLELARALEVGGVEWSCPILFSDDEVLVSIMLAKDEFFSIPLPFYVSRGYKLCSPIKSLACWVNFRTTPRLLGEALESLPALPWANTVGQVLRLKPEDLPAEVKNSRGVIYCREKSWLVDNCSGGDQWEQFYRPEGAEIIRKTFFWR